MTTQVVDGIKDQLMKSTKTVKNQGVRDQLLTKQVILLEL